MTLLCDWEGALADYQGAKGALDAIGNDELAADAIYKSLKPADPHFTAEEWCAVSVYAPLGTNIRRLLHDRSLDLEGMARKLAQDSELADAGASAFHKVRAWRAEEEKADKAANYWATNEALERAADAFCETQMRLLNTPAPDRAGALLKFDIIVGWDEGRDETPAWNWDYMGAAIADVRRILGDGE